MPLDMTEDARLALGREPIPGVSPAGSDAREGAEFEALEAEIRKMEGGGVAAVDWRQVTQHAVTILRDQSKDLLVAVYLAFGLYRQEQLPGLAVGLGILRDVTSLYWADAQPPVRRLRGRVTIYEWLNARLSQSLTASDGASEAAAITARDALQALDDFLTQTLGRDAPNLNDIMRALRPMADAAEAAIAAAAAAEVRAAQASAAQAAPEPVVARQSAAPTAPPAPVVTASAAPSLGAPPPLPEDFARAISPLRDWLRNAALMILSTNPLEPRAYGLLAQATWLPIEGLPPHRGGRTDLPAPSADRLADLRSRRAGAAQDYLHAVASFCSSSGLFWLDGQFAMKQCLTDMGPAAAQALLAHENAIRLCLAPYSGLTALTFSDGTPFIGDAGRTWLEPLLSGGQPAEAGTQPLWTKGAIAAQERMDLSKPDEAFDILTEGARDAAGQAKARWLTEALRLSLRTGDIGLALPLSRHLTGLIKCHRLADWDAEFAAEILDLATRCLSYPEIGRLISTEERGTLLTEWSTGLAGLHLARGRDATKHLTIFN